MSTLISQMISAFGQSSCNGGEQFISKNEAVRVLNKCKYRVNKNRLQVLIYNRWRNLGRTDLKDNVGTYRYEDAESPHQSILMYRKKAHNSYGARYSSKWFSIIDAFSDG